MYCLDSLKTGVSNRCFSGKEISEVNFTKGLKQIKVSFSNCSVRVTGELVPLVKIRTVGENTGGCLRESELSLTGSVTL